MNTGILFDLRAMTIEELETVTADMGEPSYRAAQLFSWLHKRYAESYDQMTDLPLAYRAKLGEACRLSACKQAGKEASQADNAIKYLFALEKNTIIESVFMRHPHGSTLCVSTQAGCRMGCRFCISGADGLERNLTAGEMCAQVYAAEHDTQERVDGVVMMGCGEPLDNFEQSVRFIRLIGHPKGHALGQRHITLSTCGLVPQIYALAELQLQITLAISLHASTDEVRRTLMPVARRFTIRETLDACAYYAEKTHRRITFEYALISGINDSDACARDLAALLRGLLCHVNIIPVNETNPLFTRSQRAELFAKQLIKRGVTATVRKSLGSDVSAACGQLRGRYVGRV